MALKHFVFFKVALQTLPIAYHCNASKTGKLNYGGKTLFVLTYWVLIYCTLSERGQKFNLQLIIQCCSGSGAEGGSVIWSYKCAKAYKILLWLLMFSC